jgi:hypothetical protein
VRKLQVPSSKFQKSSKLQKAKQGSGSSQFKNPWRAGWNPPIPDINASEDGNVTGWNLGVGDSFGTWNLEPGALQLDFLLSLDAIVCYPDFMIHRCRWLWLALIVGCVAGGYGLAADFQLVTGEMLSGEPIAPDTRGVIIKRLDGNLSERVPWTNFTQAALQEFAKALPKHQKLLEPFLIEDEPEPVRRARQEVRFNAPPRLDRPDLKAGLGALFSSPLSLTLLLLVYLANLYAAFEIALFRNYPIPLVCGIAAVAPIIGPVIFLSLPTYIPKEEVEEGPHTPEEIAYEHAVAEHVVAGHHEGAAPEGHAAGVTPGHAPPTVYQRGTTMFNRRFFETKMSGFLRVVPGEAERDMVIHVKSARGDYVAQRLSKVLPNELFLQVMKAGASSEVAIPYSEIYEIQIRHKDAA